MEVKQIKTRCLMFSQKIDDWDLNAYLIKGEKRNFIIDTGLGSEDFDFIKKFIDNRKKTIIINTHFHGDHIWGNTKKYPIIAHRLCRKLILENWDAMLSDNRQYVNGNVEKVLPDITFDSELYFEEDKIKLFYSPGHTIDSISVIDEIDKILFAGDNIGDNEEEIIPKLYCEKSTFLETLKIYEKLDFDTCVSGHNTVLKKDVIQKIMEKI
ncbi:MAG: MBL fold metallo-hydrolase [Clostridia bacterium]|nr:MBL fold metallo-hydrolase [Clostridia bacterium]